MYVSKLQRLLAFITCAAAAGSRSSKVPGLCLLQAPTSNLRKVVSFTAGTPAGVVDDAKNYHDADERFVYCCVAMVVAILLCLASTRNRQLESKSSQTLALQASVWVYSILMFVTFTAVTPDAYDVAHNLGYHAVDSGWLMGSCWPAVGFTSLTVKYISRNWQAAHREKIFPIAVTFMPAFLMMAATVVDPPTFLGPVSSEMRFNLLIISRLLTGVVDGCLFLQATLVINALSPSQLSTFNVILLCCRTLALGVGPFASGLINYEADVQQNGPLVRFSIIEYFVAALWVIYVCFNWWVMAVVPRTSSGSEAVGSDDSEVSELDDHARKTVWLAGAAWGIERAFANAALESAVAFVFRVDLHWMTTVIGMAIGCSVMATLPLTCMVWTAQGRWKLSQTNVMYSCGACVAVASLIFFPQISSKEYVTTPYMILFAYGATLSAGMIASGIIASLAMRVALPGTYYTVENLLILDSLVEDSVCKTLAPPFTRYLLGRNGGNTIFAGLQFIVCVLGFAHIRRAAQKCSHVKL
eukprot:gnl/MRDRNA2_/MRDRNA2_194720_c0_seq1.p1 gnl/MRDRNA2_/MRDRNA2_194720_c0~~gnl/MRDRNA2_/MRDRNA2_194720_c0_seq1.p1  ORF type:complete len:527 (-),score=56.79 gnl/MRDRNA2_/MRDRNA2_194720_c0_seq1:32-1612(-)